MRINRRRFAQLMAGQLQETITHTEAFIRVFEDVITKQLKAGHNINLTGFGQFMVKPRTAREGVDPRTGKRIKMPASLTPKFTAGLLLKQAVNQ